MPVNGCRWTGASRIAAGGARPSDECLRSRSDPARDGGFVITYTDVTEAEAAEAELRRAKVAAEASNQAKSRFLATMSHELRTPLNVVIGFSESLLREVRRRPDPDRVAEFAQEINDAGRQLLSLINNILDVSRIDAGRFDLSADRVDLAACCRRASDSSIRPRARPRCRCPCNCPITVLRYGPTRDACSR